LKWKRSSHEKRGRAAGGAVRSIAWLDRWRGIGIRLALVNEKLALVWV
jgi:hypothetical protein